MPHYGLLPGTARSCALRERGPGRLDASRGASEPALARPQHDGPRAFDAQVRCLSVRGAMLYSGASDNKVKVWDLKTGDCSTLFGHATFVRALAVDQAQPTTSTPLVPHRHTDTHTHTHTHTHTQWSTE